MPQTTTKERLSYFVALAFPILAAGAAAWGGVVLARNDLPATVLWAAAVGLLALVRVAAGKPR